MAAYMPCAAIWGGMGPMAVGTICTAQQQEHRTHSSQHTFDLQLPWAIEMGSWHLAVAKALLQPVDMYKATSRVYCCIAQCTASCTACCTACCTAGCTANCGLCAPAGRQWGRASQHPASCLAAPTWVACQQAQQASCPRGSERPAQHSIAHGHITPRQVL
jgi:hypothetical protein